MSRPDPPGVAILCNRFERRPMILTGEILDRAFDLTFVSEEYEE